MNFAALNRLNKYPSKTEEAESGYPADQNFDFNAMLNAPEGELNIPTSTEVPEWMQGTSETPRPEQEVEQQTIPSAAPIRQEEEAPLFSPAMLAALSKRRTSEQQEMQDAEQQSRMQKLGTGLASAGNLMGIGLGAMVNKAPLTTDASKPMLDALRADADKLPAEAKARIEARRKAELYDPSSPVSLSTLEMAKRAGIKLPEGISAGQLKDAGIDIDRLQAIKESQAQRQDLAKERLEMAKQRELDKQDERRERDIQKLSDKVAPLQRLEASVKEVESILGAPLDEFDTATDTLRLRGKKVDLPGVNIPFYGRATLNQDDAQRLESAIAKVFNTELKDRSGAAVTTHEMERMKTEFSRGAFNTEAQQINALKTYKRMALAEIQRREAAFKPDIVKEYKARLGVDSSEASPTEASPQTEPSQSTTPKFRVVNGVPTTMDGRPYIRVDGKWKRP